MTMNELSLKAKFAAVAGQCMDSGILTKVTLSKPISEELPEKKSGRCAEIRKRPMLAFENMGKSGIMGHESIDRAALEQTLVQQLELYSHAVAVCSCGNMEYMRSKKGKETLLGLAAVEKALSSGIKGEEIALPYNREAKHILTGSEDFLLKLGISDASGRVHDKRQGKFRQINRFLELLRDVYDRLPSEGILTVYDLCSGKSYLSFALYHYLTKLKGRSVSMLCADLKADVMRECASIAEQLRYTGMQFLAVDISTLKPKDKPHMVVSLHACDIATDIVLDTAVRLGAEVILSTPCCHRYLRDKINAAPLKFITDHPHLRGKLGDVLTDGLRTLILKSEGYRVEAVELVDPGDTPKNTLLRCVKKKSFDPESRQAQSLKREYSDALSFLMGEQGENYLKDVLK